MEQDKTREASAPQHVGKVNDKTKIKYVEKLCKKREKKVGDFDMLLALMYSLGVLFFMAMIYAIYDTYIKDKNSIGHHVLVTEPASTTVGKAEESKPSQMEDQQKRAFLENAKKMLHSTEEITRTENNSPNQVKIIGKWYDRVMKDVVFSYTLYEEKGKMFLNYSDVKTSQCALYKIKGQEYVFRDENARTFVYAPGTSVYVAKGFEESMDRNGNIYLCDMILLQQGNYLIVYMNDHEKSIYDQICVAYK